MSIDFIRRKQIKSIKWWIVAGLILIMVGTMCKTVGAVQRERVKESIKPQLNHGEKWRIAYVLFDESSEYVNTLDNLLKGLIKSGWLDVDEKTLAAYPKNAATESQTINLWQWMKKQESTYLDFVDCYYPSNEVNDLSSFSQEVIQGLKDEKIDLVIVMGDVAAQRLISAGCKTKMMVVGTSNPVMLGFVEGAKASGKKNIWAHVDEEKYENQLRVFYDTFPFKKLGVIYDEKRLLKTEQVKVEAIKKVAKEKKFEVIYKTLADDNRDGEFMSRAKIAYSEMAKEVDAVYLTQYQSQNNIDLETLLTPFYENHVLTFSETAANVHKGVLMSATHLEDEGAGTFYEQTFSKLLVTEDVSEIKQEYTIPPQLILNVDAAKKTEQKIEFELILAADQIVHQAEE